MEEELVTIDDRSDTMDQTFFSSPGYYVPTNTIYQDKKAQSYQWRMGELQVASVSIT